MTTMYTPGQVRMLQAEVDALKAERDALLEAATAALWYTSTRIGDDDSYKPHQLLAAAIDKAEGRE